MMLLNNGEIPAQQQVPEDLNLQSSSNQYLAMTDIPLHPLVPVNVQKSQSTTQENLIITNIMEDPAASCKKRKATCNERGYG
jgi:hypothetical protein